MTVLFEEMNREEIKTIAPQAIGVLPTAATEQHGPHMAVGTDTLLCTTVARRAAEAVGPSLPVVVAPPVAFGSSHHHYPFGGVLSLTSNTFMAVVSEVAQGMARTGFRKLVLLNGHGGNSDHVGVVSQDLVTLLGVSAVVASCNYWDLARPALVEADLMPGSRIPGHAGQFETSLIMALRPEWVDAGAQAKVENQSSVDAGLDVDLGAAVVQSYGTWQAGPGYTDDPEASSVALGMSVLEIIVDRVAGFLSEFDRVPGPTE